MGAPYDQRIATQAAAIDQCLKMGAVVLNPKPKAGFGPPKPPGADDGRRS